MTEDELEGKLYLWHLEVPQTAFRALVLAEDEDEALRTARKVEGCADLPWEVGAFAHVATVPFLVCLVDRTKVLVMNPEVGKPN